MHYFKYCNIHVKIIWLLLGQYWGKLGNFLFHHLVTLFTTPQRQFRDGQGVDMHFWKKFWGILFPPFKLGIFARPWTVRISVTRWLDYFSIFGHLQNWKLAQKCHKFPKVGSTFYQIRNKPSKICQKLIKICQIWSHWSESICRLDFLKRLWWDLLSQKMASRHRRRLCWHVGDRRLLGQYHWIKFSSLWWDFAANFLTLISSRIRTHNRTMHVRRQWVSLFAIPDLSFAFSIHNSFD